MIGTFWRETTRELIHIVWLECEEKTNFRKKVPPVGIKPRNLGLWDLFCLHSNAFLTEITWQVLNVHTPIDFLNF